MIKNSKKVEHTKEKIRNALLFMLQDNEIHKIRISHLCKEARVNRGTFYLHYDTTEEVFEELYEQVIIDLKTAYENPTYSIKTFYIQNINAQQIKIFYHIKKYQNFYDTIFSNKVNSSYYYKLFDQLRINLKNSFIYSNDAEEDIDYFIGYHVNAIIGVILVWYQREFKEAPEEMNYILYSIYSKSIQKRETL